MEYNIYYIFDKSNVNECDYFLTKNNISKALYAFKRNKTDTIIKQIILKNNYETRLFKIYRNISKCLLNDELKKIRAFHIENKKQMKRFYSTITDYSSTFGKSGAKTELNDEGVYLHTLTKNNSLNYGQIREQYVYDLICNNNLFNPGKTRAKYIYSEFDFFDTDNYLYEVKALRYSIKQYNTAVMNTSKLIYDNYVFIFEYTENDKQELYYYLYDANRNYNTRYIKPNSRLNICEIIDIPINELTKFYDGKNIIPFENPCKLITDKNQFKLFEELIWRDEMKSLVSF